MKNLLSFLFLLLSFFTFSQDVYVLRMTIFDNCTKNYVSYTESILYNDSKEVSSSFIDENGRLSLIIDKIFYNDSIYFCLITKDSLKSKTKIFLNELNFFKINNIANYSIKIISFNSFTIEEYKKYCKENGLIPRRKKTLAKDVD